MPLPVFSGSLNVKMNLLRGTLLALAVLLSSVLSSEVEIVRTKAAPKLYEVDTLEDTKGAKSTTMQWNVQQDRMGRQC